MGAILANPQVVPHTCHWVTEERIDVPLLIYQIINQPGYLEASFPSLRIILGRNLSNTAWAANVLVTLAFYDLIKILPQSHHLRRDR